MDSYASGNAFSILTRKKAIVTKQFWDDWQIW